MEISQRSPQKILLTRLSGLMVILLLTSSILTSSQAHTAAQRGKLDEVKILIEKNPDLINSRDKNGRTPLHLACRGGHPEVVKFLVKKGADVNAEDSNKIRPLHSLAVRNQAEAIVLIISSGADVDSQDHGGHSALHYAAMNNSDLAADILIKKGAGIELRNDYLRTPLLLCARERGGPETTAVLIRGKADVNAKDKFGATSLDLAAWRGKEEVVNLLLDAGAEIKAKGGKARSLFSQAASAGLTRLFNSVIEAGGDPGFSLSNGGTLMHAAAAGGTVKIMEILSREGLDINLKDRYGWTPLHYAARDGRMKAVEWLSKQGAELNSRTVMGQSPLNVAEERKFDTVRKLLADKGADAGPIQFPYLQGDYLGQTPPGNQPELFAPGIVSSVWGIHSTAIFSPDRNTVLWAPMVSYPGKIYSEGGLMMSERKNGRWTAPRLAPFADPKDSDVPFFSPDGTRIYFITSLPLPGKSGSGSERIWYCERQKEGWGPAKPVDPSVNTFPHHWQFSVDSGHTIYFSSDIPEGRGGGDIYAAEYVDGRWQKPTILGPAINTEKSEGMPYITPDGSFLLFSREYNLYISFRQKDGDWREARSLGRPINSMSIDICPVLSPDGKYLFFVSQRGGESHAWWVDAGFIERLKKEKENAPADYESIEKR